MGCCPRMFVQLSSGLGCWIRTAKNSGKKPKIILAF
jgi:hypothetical protein